MLKIQKKCVVVLLIVLLITIVARAKLVCVYAAEDYQMICDGDWSLLNNPDMPAQMQFVFSQVYPRLIARWGEQDKHKQSVVSVQIVPQATIGEQVVGGYTAYEEGTWNRYVVIGATDNNRRRDRLGVLVHELTHVVECYGYFESDWWTEELANYGEWRYFNWTEPQFMPMNKHGNLYNENLLDYEWRDWKWIAHEKSELFFTYMDSRFPTTIDVSGKKNYGLIDTVHFAIQEGKIDNDKMDNPQLNRIVKEITGLDNMEQLRQQFASELATGTWVFNGFAEYVDNVITENLPGVKNPSYPAQNFAGNLCSGATIYKCSGAASENSLAEFLVDNDLNTKWSATPENVNRQDKWLAKKTQHYVILNLENEVELDAYAIYHAGTKEDLSRNAARWNVLYWDSKRQQWQIIDSDYVNTSNKNITTRVFEPVCTQYLYFEFLDSDQIGSGNINIYEIVCMNTKYIK